VREDRKISVVSQHATIEIKADAKAEAQLKRGISPGAGGLQSAILALALTSEITRQKDPKMFKAIDAIYANMAKLQGVTKIPPYPKIYITDADSKYSFFATAHWLQNEDPKDPHYSKLGNASTIQVNRDFKDLDFDRKVSVLAHEIGHLFSARNPALMKTLDPVSKEDVKQDLTARIQKFLDVVAPGSTAKSYGKLMDGLNADFPNTNEEHLADFLSVETTGRANMKNYFDALEKRYENGLIHDYYDELHAEAKELGKKSFKLLSPEQQKKYEAEAVTSIVQNIISDTADDTHPSLTLRAKEMEKEYNDLDSVVTSY